MAEKAVSPFDKEIRRLEGRRERAYSRYCNEERKRFAKYISKHGWYSPRRPSRRRDWCGSRPKCWLEYDLETKELKDGAILAKPKKRPYVELIWGHPLRTSLVVGCTVNSRCVRGGLKNIQTMFRHHDWPKQGEYFDKIRSSEDKLWEKRAEWEEDWHNKFKKERANRMRLCGHWFTGDQVMLVSEQVILLSHDCSRLLETLKRKKGGEHHKNSTSTKRDSQRSNRGA